MHPIRASRPFCLLPFVALVACGGPDVPADTADVPMDASRDVITPAGAPPALSWADGPAVPMARDHHATFVVDTGSARYLYVAGGFDGTASLTSVVRAPIAADGSLSAWETVTPLPRATSGMGVVVTHGEVILTGGSSTRDTMRAAIEPDGSLGAWTMGPLLAGPRFHACAATFGDFVYVVGGIALNQTVDDVARAAIATDGSLGDWQVVAHLPYTLSHEGCALVDRTLYVVGGSTGNTNNNTAVGHREVWTAPIATDGSVGAFAAGPDFPTYLVTQASFYRAGYLYQAGGLTSDGAEANDTITASVWRAPVASDGTLGDWVQDGASMPVARSHVHQMPMLDSHVYSAAGATSDLVAIDRVFVGTLQ